VRRMEGISGSPPCPIVRPTDGWRTAGGVEPPYGRPSVAYVTPSRRATRTALSNSSSARACHISMSPPSAASHLPRWEGGEGGGWVLWSHRNKVLELLRFTNRIPITP